MLLLFGTVVGSWLLSRGVFVCTGLVGARWLRKSDRPRQRLSHALVRNCARSACQALPNMWFLSRVELVRGLVYCRDEQ